MEFEKLIEERRSVRSYQASEVEHDVLETIVKQAQMAPSWKNSQTARTYVAEGGEMLQKLRTQGLPEFNQKSSANASLIVTTFVKDTAGFTKGEPDTEIGNFWGAYDLGLHDAYLVLAAKNAGYDTLIMGIRNPEEIRKLLEIPEDEVIVSVIAVGKRDKEPAFRPRKELGEVVHFIG